MEAKSRHDHSCRLGRRALIQKKKKKKHARRGLVHILVHIASIGGLPGLFGCGETGQYYFIFFFSWILGEMPFILRELGSKQKLVKIREQGSEKKKINK